MNNIAVLGLFFGDEGKGRIVYEMSQNHNFVVRFSGSSNAGHTIYDEGKKIVRRLLPCVNFNVPNTKAFLASGMVINPDDLLKEVKETEGMFPGSAHRIIVDPDAFAILPEHLEEDKQNMIKFGSTGKGVSPAYRDKVNRCGKKIFDILEDNKSLIELKQMGVKFQTVLELKSEFELGGILFEGSQAILLDINFGTYPCVTSGDCGIGGIINSGFAFCPLDKVYGVVKAYSTRVGEGPYPTEIFGEEAEKLRERGKEYGAVTGRPRRVGWLDLPAIRYAKSKAGVTDLIVTKLDILDGMDRVPICYYYNNKDIYPNEPSSGRDFFTAQANYALIQGWNNSKDINQIKYFIDFIQDNTFLPIRYVSCGVNKEDLVKLS
jgi:adenylosuccinate synthase